MIEPRRRARPAIGSAVGLIAAFCLVNLGSTALADTTWRPDAWITAKTKIALATDEQVSATDINVDTVNNRVTLHGAVQSQEAKDKAGEIASNIEGATDVRNLLQVVPAEKMAATERQDSEIQASVEQALEKDAELRSSSIEVQSVNDGVVLLGGSAAALTTHLEAIRVASRVEGVRRVETEVETGDQVYDEQLWRDPDIDIDVDETITGQAAGAADRTADAIADAGKATGAAIAGAGEATVDAAGDAAGAVRDTAAGAVDTVTGTAEDTADTVARNTEEAVDETAETTGEVAHEAREATAGAAGATAEAAATTGGALRDAWITTATKTRLLADPDTPALSINVDTEDGVVTLFGTVSSEQARDEAIAHARAVSGNVEVNDQLTIDAGAVAGDDVAKQPTDDELAERIRGELDQTGGLAEAQIEVAVDDGIAKLSGTAPDHAIKMSAATTARSIEGVRAVENKIRVESKS